METSKQITIDERSLEQLAVACRILKTAVVRMIPMSPVSDDRTRDAKEQVWVAATEILTTLEHFGVPTDSAVLAGEKTAIDPALLGSDANQKLYRALDVAYDAMDNVYEERNRPGDFLAHDLLLLLLRHVRRELQQAGALSEPDGF